MANPRKGVVTTVEIRGSEEVVQNALRSSSLDVDRAGAVRTLIHVPDKYPTLFNLDPEPEKPLRINLNLDQLEDYEE